MFDIKILFLYLNIISSMPPISLRIQISKLKLEYRSQKRWEIYTEADSIIMMAQHKQNELNCFTC